ncbi:MAG: CDP-alcohol phosphatidyltransferase family protein [Bacteroidales bacterium]|nr:CDP-alcohol phosphatidyltransferase family protein [Bacteroidales bacterium]
MTLTKHIPNTVTCLNLLCGTVGIVTACSGMFRLSFCLMLGAALCDFLDGAAARLFHAYSEKGRELDSLADIISFGVLPAVMLCLLMKAYSFGQGTPQWLCYTPLLIAPFSALRLAKFNLDARQHTTFLGLPTPACAMLCGSLAYYTASSPSSFLSVWTLGGVFVPALTLVLCFLLVCEIPMFSMKISREDRVENRKRIAFGINLLIVGAIVLVLKVNWSMVILLGFVVYILMNVVYFLVLGRGTQPSKE